MTYISYSNIYANLVRNCLKKPFKSEDLTHEKVHFSISKWDNGVPQKPSFHQRTSAHCHQLYICLWRNNRKKELIK
uniref:ATP synthase subunit epsilon, mitochondrial n=1 Tax=Vitis vinifera TaxID=29760 RepID=F6GW10_VITVI